MPKLTEEQKAERTAKRAIKEAEERYFQKLYKKMSKILEGFAIDKLEVANGKLHLVNHNADWDGHGDVTFDTLAILSEMFGTRDINLHAKSGNGGYCETCAYTYTAQYVYIEKITTWPQVDDM